MRLCSLGEVVAAGDDCAVRAAWIDDHHLVVRGCMIRIQQNPHPAIGEVAHQAGTDRVGLLLVRDDGYVYATVAGTDERLRNAAMRKTERLHEYLLTGAGDCFDDHAVRTLTGRKSV